MAIEQSGDPTSRKPLRLWPGVAAVVLQWLARFGVKMVVPGFKGFAWAMQSQFVFGFVFLVWWLFFSRARWAERLGGLALMIAAMFATWGLKHESMGPLWLLGYAIPVLFLAFAVWAVATRRLPERTRRVTMVATILAACGVWTLFKTGGINGDHDAEFSWRWTETSEDRLVAHADDPLEALAPPQAEAGTEADWPGFRGPGRDSIVRGVRIETDWSKWPPVELWRRPIGPGWSSFAVHGGLLYTQEQRGDDEVVACYAAATGKPVWTHHDKARFIESNAGAGPRATPTLSGGRVYALGATGILNALDARGGAVVWSRNMAADTKVEVPSWGFSSSPLVVGDVVIVAAGGELVAYDLAGGEPRWRGPAGGGYSSPQLFTIGGVTQVLQLRAAGATSVVPADGTLLWEHRWQGFPIVQPALTTDGDLLLSVSSGSGTRRIGVAHEPGGWTAQERWTSNGLKPYFNDFVIHGGHAYGFDGRILSCIDLQGGQRKWKGGRYGNGQLLLLPDQDLLLVLSEEGELALVAATPDQFTELARFPAIKGKTWNHPVLVGDLLLVRNGQEMAAFRLSLAGG